MGQLIEAITIVHKSPLDPDIMEKRELFDTVCGADILSSAMDAEIHLVLD